MFLARLLDATLSNASKNDSSILSSNTLPGPDIASPFVSPLPHDAPVTSSSSALESNPPDYKRLFEHAQTSNVSTPFLNPLRQFFFKSIEQVAFSGRKHEEETKLWLPTNQPPELHALLDASQITGHLTPRALWASAASGIESDIEVDGDVRDANPDSAGHSNPALHGVGSRESELDSFQFVPERVRSVSPGAEVGFETAADGPPPDTALGCSSIVELLENLDLSDDTSPLETLLRPALATLALSPNTPGLEANNGFVFETAIPRLLQVLDTEEARLKAYVDRAQDTLRVHATVCVEGSDQGYVMQPACHWKKMAVRTAKAADRLQRRSAENSSSLITAMNAAIKEYHQLLYAVRYTRTLSHALFHLQTAQNAILHQHYTEACTSLKEWYESSQDKPTRYLPLQCMAGASRQHIFQKLSLFLDVLIPECIRAIQVPMETLHWGSPDFPDTTTHIPDATQQLFDQIQGLQLYQNLHAIMEDLSSDVGSSPSQALHRSSMSWAAACLVSGMVVRFRLLFCGPTEHLGRVDFYQEASIHLIQIVQRHVQFLRKYPTIFPADTCDTFIQCLAQEYHRYTVSYLCALHNAGYATKNKSDSCKEFFDPTPLIAHILKVFLETSRRFVFLSETCLPVLFYTNRCREHMEDDEKKDDKEKRGTPTPPALDLPLSLTNSFLDLKAAVSRPTPGEATFEQLSDKREQQGLLFRSASPLKEGQPQRHTLHNPAHQASTVFDFLCAFDGETALDMVGMATQHASQSVDIPIHNLDLRLSTPSGIWDGDAAADRHPTSLDIPPTLASPTYYRISRVLETLLEALAVCETRSAILRHDSRLACLYSDQVYFPAVSRARSGLRNAWNRLDDLRDETEVCRSENVFALFYDASTRFLEPETILHPRFQMDKACILLQSFQLGVNSFSNLGIAMPPQLVSVSQTVYPPARYFSSSTEHVTHTCGECTLLCLPLFQEISEWKAITEKMTTLIIDSVTRRSTPQWTAPVPLDALFFHQFRRIVQQVHAEPVRSLMISTMGQTLIVNLLIFLHRDINVLYEEERLALADNCSALELSLKHFSNYIPSPELVTELQKLEDIRNILTAPIPQARKALKLLMDSDLRESEPSTTLHPHGTPHSIVDQRSNRPPEAPTFLGVQLLLEAETLLKKSAQQWKFSVQEDQKQVATREPDTTHKTRQDALHLLEVRILDAPTVLDILRKRREFVFRSSPGFTLLPTAAEQPLQT